MLWEGAYLVPAGRHRRHGRAVHFDSLILLTFAFPSKNMECRCKNFYGKERGDVNKFPSRDDRQLMPQPLPVSRDYGQSIE